MLLSFETWWQAMEIAEKIYWCIAIPFSIVFIIQLIMTLVGGDFDASSSTGDADVAVDSDHGIGFQFISIKNLIGFFTIFSWTGIACTAAGLNPILTVVIAVVAGLIMMLLMGLLIYYMGKLAEDGSMKMEDAIGKTATVYLTIPAKRSAQGKVQLTLHGFQTLDAVTDDAEELKNGNMVKVVDIINHEILLVTKL
ncbi:MAG TPA: serine protease [Bacteroidales bacterium]|nr:serine protease [Bacteroidales bacterium]